MHIVAIGGGDKTPIMRAVTDDLTHPDVLIVPTACSTEKSYERKVSAIQDFFDSFGMPYVVLHEFNEQPTQTKLDHEFGQAALAYVIGGNTPHLLETSRMHGTDIALRQHVSNGLTLAGTSAGALLPFALLHSNPAKKPAEEIWDYTFYEGLGIVPAAVAVHADQYDMTPQGLRNESRLEHFAAHLPQGTIGYAIENNAALEIRGDTHRVLRSEPNANVYVTINGSTAKYSGSTPPF